MSARRTGHSDPCPSAPRALSEPPTRCGISAARSPAAGSSFPTRAGSRVCTGSGQVALALRDWLLVNTGSASFMSPQPGIPNSPLGDLKRLRLRLVHPTHPTSPRLIAKQARTTLPLRSSPITGPSPLLREGPPLRPASLLSPSQISCLGFSLQTASRRREAEPLGLPVADRPSRFPSSARRRIALVRRTAPCGHPPGRDPSRPPPGSSERDSAPISSVTGYAFDTSTVVRFRSSS